MQPASLFREIGLLKEQLEREKHRRQKAVERATASEAARQEAEREVARLRYVSRQVGGGGLEEEVQKERRRRREAGLAAKESMQSLAARIPVIEATIMSRNQRQREQSVDILDRLRALRSGILGKGETGLQRAPLLDFVDQATPLSSPAAPSPGNPDRVSGALEQMESVLPRYRAATLAAQTQCAVLREALSATERERDELAQQLSKWRLTAETEEARAAELGAALHSERERSVEQAAALNAELQSARHELTRAAARAAALEERERVLEATVARGRAELQETRGLLREQRETAAELEQLVSAQASDVTAALELVARRGGDEGLNAGKPGLYAADEARVAKQRVAAAESDPAWRIPSARRQQPADDGLEDMLRGLQLAVAQAMAPEPLPAHH